MVKNWKNSLRKLVRILKKSKRPAIATHIDPDADGICAALACAHLVIHFIRKAPVLFCHSPIPERYRFLLGDWKFRRKKPSFDVLMAVDSTGINRIFPHVYFRQSADIDSKVIINIDHHKSNDSFGLLKIVEEDVSSACEIIYNIFTSLKITIDRTLAEIFYCGIYSETGGFVYPNTTKNALVIAGELVGRGVNAADLVKKLNEKTLDGTILLSRVLSTIEIKNGVGSMYVTQKMLQSSHAVMTDSENFVSFLQAIKEVRVSVFLREEHDCTRVSLRSDGIIDVDRIAALYGGGGHRLAAGARISSSLSTVKKKLLTVIHKEIQHKQRERRN